MVSLCVENWTYGWILDHQTIRDSESEGIRTSGSSMQLRSVNARVLLPAGTYAVACAPPAGDPNSVSVYGHAWGAWWLMHLPNTPMGCMAMHGVCHVCASDATQLRREGDGRAGYCSVSILRLGCCRAIKCQGHRWRPCTHQHTWRWMTTRIVRTYIRSSAPCKGCWVLTHAGEEIEFGLAWFAMHCMRRFTYLYCYICT
jgi:hypothetical protein